MKTKAELEREARRIAARNLARTIQPGEDLDRLVEEHWRSVAEDLEAGLIDAEGLPRDQVSTSR